MEVTYTEHAKNFTDVTGLLERKLKEYGFIQRGTMATRYEVSDEMSFCVEYFGRQEEVIVYGISVTGNYASDIKIIVFGDPMKIDTGFAYKIVSTQNRAFFGRATRELISDFEEAIGDFL